MADSPTADPPHPRRRGWLTVGALLAMGVITAVLQATPAERIPHFVNNAPVNIAHAGAQGYAPQNTIPALALAAEQGADVLEMDLQLTADEPDPLVVRSTGGPRCPGRRTGRSWV